MLLKSPFLVICLMAMLLGSCNNTTTMTQQVAYLKIPMLMKAIRPRLWERKRL